MASDSWINWHTSISITQSYDVISLMRQMVYCPIYYISLQIIGEWFKSIIRSKYLFCEFSKESTLNVDENKCKSRYKGTIGSNLIIWIYIFCDVCNRSIESIQQISIKRFPAWPAFNFDCRLNQCSQTLFCTMPPL